MRDKLGYVDCQWDNMVGYSAEYWCGAMEEKTFRKCLAKAVRECDPKTLLWLAKTVMKYGNVP